jgi:hypothetical protein
MAPSSFSVVAIDGPEVRGFGLIQRDGEIQKERVPRRSKGRVTSKRS